MRYYVAFQILEKMQKLILILQDSIITNNNIFMLSIKSDKAWLLEAMLKLEALPLFYIKHPFIQQKLTFICITQNNFVSLQRNLTFRICL